MNNARTKLGNKLFDLAAQIYPKGKKGDTFSKELGNMLFKLAARVSPDKKARPQPKARARTKTPRKKK